MSGGKILVVRGGAIGDFILTLPVLAALREQFPQARLEVLGYPHIASLAEAGGLVDAVRSIEARALAGFFARNGALDDSLRNYFAGFAVVISFLYDPDGVFQANVARCSKAQFIAGPHRPHDWMPLHATEVFLKPLERLAIFAPDSTPRLSMKDEKIASWNSPPAWIAIHPGSGSERKNWPEENWAETLMQLHRQSDARLLLVGGEAEGERLIRLARRCLSERIEIMQDRPLVEVAKRLSRCAAFAGHDSGISHLAAALGRPTVVLWLETVEAVWCPKGPRVVVLKNEGGLGNLKPQEVVAAIHTMALASHAE